MVREVLSLAVGGCGVGLSLAEWQLHALEAALRSDGRRDHSQHTLERPDDPLSALAVPHDTQHTRAFFAEDSRGRFTPRALLVDCDSERINAARSGVMRDLFTSDSFLASDDGSAATYARGRLCAQGQGRLLEAALERVRRMADACDNLQGFVLTHSIGGGSGSGLAAEIMQAVKQEYAKSVTLSFGVFPSYSSSASVVEPYNGLLAQNSALQGADVCVVLESQAAEELCRKRLGIERPTHDNINRLTAHAVSSVTASMRLGGTLNASLEDLCSSTIPYPRLRYATVAHGPLYPSSRASLEQPSIFEMTSGLFAAENQFVRMNPQIGRTMAAMLSYRGDLVPKEINACLTEIKKTDLIEFVDWSSCGYRCGLIYSPSERFPDDAKACFRRAVSSLVNSTSVSQVFDRMESTANRLFSKRAYLHWYTRDGVEESEFTEAREDLAMLQQDYSEVGAEYSLDDEEEAGAEY